MKSEYRAIGISLYKPPNLILGGYKRGCCLIIYQFNLTSYTEQFLTRFSSVNLLQRHYNPCTHINFKSLRETYLNWIRFQLKYSHSNRLWTSVHLPPDQSLIFLDRGTTGDFNATTICLYIHRKYIIKLLNTCHFQVSNRLLDRQDPLLDKGQVKGW